ncbi:glutathione S-transferase APIC-like [Impatiens glandulifera]|uniref:glutathione S-transferase APIC-like n=1 Tax=Impatiens glandulifera TaxID=253017 RepID=UPI001FB10EB5|nr:glutathione S-transferase APIC-like [Impatiens glandulifera]
MSVRKVYGSMNCPDTLKVITSLFEHNLDFDFISIDFLNGENLLKPFLSMNPFGKGPVFQDKDFSQFGARSILRAMGHQYAKNVSEPLIFHNGKEQAIVSNWIDVEDDHFEPAARELITMISSKLPNDENVIFKFGMVLDEYETRLGKSPYLAAKRFTIADLLHIPNLHTLMETAVTKKLIESRPKVAAWCNQLLARPAWKKVLDMKK